MNMCWARTGAPPSSGISGRRSFRRRAQTVTRRRSIDPLTGAIDKKVVAYWHDHYDLTAIMKRDWPTLGPKLEGKLHLTVGDGDTYFLNNAVHLLQDQTRHDAQSALGRDFPVRPAHAALLYRRPVGVHHAAEQRRLDRSACCRMMVEHMLATAPAGADVKSWRY